MFNVSGLVYIAEAPVEESFKDGAFLKFKGVTKDPDIEGPKGRNYYTISMFVQGPQLGEARRKIVAEKMLWIIRGRLKGSLGPNGGIYMQINTSYKECLPLIRHQVEK